MTTNKPEVAAYRYTASRSFGKRNPKWHYQESFPHAGNREVEEIGRLEELIRLSDYERLEAEFERLRKDAERYRWLRDKCDRWDGGLVVAEVTEFSLSSWSGDDLNGAIDEAMAKEVPRG